MQNYKQLFWILDPWAGFGSVLNCFALLKTGEAVPKYQPGTCVLVAFCVNYWQSTNGSEESCFQLCISLPAASGASCSRVC